MRVTNAMLLVEIAKSRETGVPTEALAEMWHSMAYRIAKMPKHNHFEHRDDMVSHALVHLCQSGLKFDASKSQNPFAFFHTCIYGSFINYLHREKKHEKLHT